MNWIAEIIGTRLIVITEAVLWKGRAVRCEVTIADGTADIILAGDVIGSVRTAVDLVTTICSTDHPIITL